MLDYGFQDRDPMFWIEGPDPDVYLINYDPEQTFMPLKLVTFLFSS